MATDSHRVDDARAEAAPRVPSCWAEPLALGGGVTETRHASSASGRLWSFSSSSIAPSGRHRRSIAPSAHRQIRSLLVDGAALVLRTYRKRRSREERSGVPGLLRALEGWVRRFTDSVLMGSANLSCTRTDCVARDEGSPSVGDRHR